MSVVLQKWIHQMEEGAGASIIRAMTATLVFFALAMVHQLRESRSLGAPEVMDQAQIARSLASGDGFQTQFIRPQAIQLMEKKQGTEVDLTQSFPDVSNAPGWPWLMGKMFSVSSGPELLDATGAEAGLSLEKRIRWGSQLLYYMILVSLFRLGIKLFDGRVAWLSVILMGGADVFWKVSLAGVSILLSTWLLLMAVLLIVSLISGIGEKEWSGGKAIVFAVLGGVFFAGAALTSYGLLWLLIPFLLVIPVSIERLRVPVSVAFLLTVIVCIAPWCSRNLELTGQMFGTAGSAVYEDSYRFPEDRLGRLLIPDETSAEDTGDYSVEEHWMKFRGNIGAILNQSLPGMGGGWIFGFFVAGLLIPFSRPVLTRLRWWLVGSMAVLTLVQALGQSRMTDLTGGITAEYYLLNLGPLVVLFGVAMFSTLLDQFSKGDLKLERLAMGGMCILLCLPLVIRLLEPKKSIEFNPPYFPMTIAEGASWLSEDEWMMSDMPWAVAWYGRRDCVFYTWDVDTEFAALHQRRPIASLYLTSVTLDRKLVSELDRGENKLWGMLATEAVVNGEVPDAFPLGEGFAEWFPYQLYLSDRPRWADE